MAEKDNKKVPFARVLQKTARAKERFLRNLGKADRTTDVDFDLCIKNFNKQQSAVTKLHKEFMKYHHCLKAMQASRKSLMDTVCELYEPGWNGVDVFTVKTEDLNRNFEDFCEKINNLVLTPVSSYIVQFPELSQKIGKRDRKLLDYDICRRNLENLETLKKREEAKVTKAKEALEEARNLFEVINSELHDELPALYDSRISFFVSYLQCLYLAEAHFHSQDSAILVELNTVLESLDEACKKNGIEKTKSIESQLSDCEKDDQYRDRDGSSSGSASGSIIFSTPPTSVTRNKEKDIPHEENSEINSVFSNNEVPSKIQEQIISLEKVLQTTVSSENISPETQTVISSEELFPKAHALEPSEIISSTAKTVLPPKGKAQKIVPPNGSTDKKSSFFSSSIFSKDKESKENVELEQEDSSSPGNYKHLYQVQATYKYVAEDMDELSFDTGDIIDVIAYDDPEEQEEGWLMGVFNGRKGLFPANFTSRV